MNDLIESNVRISNRLTESKFDYSSYEINVLCLIIKKMAGANYVQLQFKNKELTEFMPDNNDKHDKLRLTLRGLMKKSIEWFYTIDKSYYCSSLVSGYKIDTVHSITSINIDPFLLPLLIDLKREFTIFQLQSILKLKSKFSKRIYLMCCQFYASGIFNIGLIELKKRLQLVDKYSDFSDFNKRVLKVAIEEINQMSELDIELLTNKNGKQIETVTFLITLKKAVAEVSTDDRMSSFMQKEGLSKWQCVNIFASLPVDSIRTILYNYQQYRQKVKNTGAYLTAVFADAGVNMNGKLKRGYQTDLEEESKKLTTLAEQNYLPGGAREITRARQKFSINNESHNK